MSNWKQNMADALAAEGCTTQTEWVAKFPGRHCWFLYGDYESCASCGVVRQRNDKNKPCRGIVTIGLR